MRFQDEVRAVHALSGQRLSDYEIARRTGIPRSTVQHWRRSRRMLREKTAQERPPWRPADPSAYSYLLGMYFGDGCISGKRDSQTGTLKTAFLCIYLDSRYPKIIDECEAAIRTNFPGLRVGRRTRHPAQLTILQVNSSAILDALPHHGRGRKHERLIKLHHWQREIVDIHPRQFLRGLIHSDGCRCLNCFTVNLPSGPRHYRYVRYYFSNLSVDIRGLFCESCDRLGIHWTQSNHRNISVADRRSVAILDSFVGPKR